MDLRDTTILLTGGSGFVGQHVVDVLRERGVPRDRIVIPDSSRDDLRIYSNCERLFSEHPIDIVIHLAALVGGVGYSSMHPATQYYNNIVMDAQIVEAAKNANVKKVVMVSSSCAYPQDAENPLREEYFWNGLPQETNRTYGVAKRLASVQGPAYREEFGLNVVVVVPNNAYGPGDNFDPEYSHVIPALIRRCVAGESPLVVWGDGTPTRDFLYVKDFAEGVVRAAERLETDEYVNLGSGVETSVKELTALVRKLTGHAGGVVYDPERPMGQPRRSVDISRARTLLDFKPRYTLEEGLRETIEWYEETGLSKVSQV